MLREILYRIEFWIKNNSKLIWLFAVGFAFLGLFCGNLNLTLISVLLLLYLHFKRM